MIKRLRQPRVSKTARRPRLWPCSASSEKKWESSRNSSPTIGCYASISMLRCSLLKVRANRRFLMKAVIGFTALTLLLYSIAGLADTNPLIGTWKLKSYVTTTTTGERSTPFGEHPSGYISYSADGRMQAIGTADGRIVPHDVALSDEERAILHRTMFAYAGTYTIGPDQVIHHVDISWNQIWNGTDQVRFYKLTRNILTITQPRGRSGLDGREGQSVLVWQKVVAPTLMSFAAFPQSLDY